MDNLFKDGDNGFSGVDTRMDPRLLQPGEVSEAINKVFTQNQAETRLGFQETPWARNFGFSFPFDFDLDFNDQQGLGTIYGSSLYTDRGGNESILAVGSKFVYRISESGTYELLRYPNDETVDAESTLIQAFNRVYLFRGVTKDPLVWDGTSNGDFVKATVSSISIAFPKAEVAVYFNNRLWVVRNRDELLYSGIDAADTWLESQQFKINLGTQDKVTGIVPFGETSLVIFKENSIYLLQNLVGDISQNAQLDLLVSSQGCTSPDTAVQIGRDVWFFNERGLYSINLTFENKLQANAEPISIPMQGIIDQINWNNKQFFHATYYDNKYILSVTLTGSTYNNAILVFDFVSGKWAGYHTAGFLDTKYFLQPLYQNRRALMYVSGNGRSVSDEHGCVINMYAGFFDEILGTKYEIEDSIITRGYTFQTTARKQLKHIELDHETWYPEYSVKLLSDGPAEDINVITDETKSNVKYMTFGTTDYDPTNTNNDHNTPYREDYSLAIPTEIYIDNLGVAFDQHQRTQLRRRVIKKGEYFQIQITSTRGRQKIHSITVESYNRPENQTTRS